MILSLPLLPSLFSAHPFLSTFMIWTFRWVHHYRCGLSSWTHLRARDRSCFRYPVDWCCSICWRCGRCWCSRCSPFRLWWGRLGCIGNRCRVGGRRGWVSSMCLHWKARGWSSWTARVLGASWNRRLLMGLRRCSPVFWVESVLGVVYEVGSIVL